MSDDVDRMLHHDANRGSLGPPPPSFDRLMSAAMVQRRRDRRLAPLVLVASVIAFACLVSLPYFVFGQSHPVAQAPVTAHVPWSIGAAPSAAPSPSVFPEAPLGLPVCDDSSFTGSVSTSPTATGGLQFSVVLTSTASERCMIASHGPTVSFFDAAGRKLATGTNKLLYASKGVSAVRRGQVVKFMATWDQWCGAVPVTGEGTLEVWLEREPVGGLGSGKKMPASIDAVPTCNADIAHDSDLFASDFEVLESGELGTLTAALDVPHSVVSGHMLHSKVVLSNHSTVAVALTPCPAFVQTLQSSAGNVTATEVSVLNCSAAPKTIRPGDVVELDLQFRMPASTAGKYDLTWHWRDTPCCDDEASGAILVTPS